MSNNKPISKINIGSLTKKTTGGFLWLSSGKAFQALLQIGVLAVLARLISPESFGVAQIALIVVGFANLLSQMGIGPALIQRRELTSIHLRVGFTFSLVMGVALGGITFFCSGLIATFFGMPNLEEVIKAISIVFVIESFIVVSVSLLQKKMRFKEFAFVNIISYLIGYGFIGIIMGYLGYGVWALIFAFISQAIIKAFIVSILEPYSIFPSFKRRELRELLYFGGGFTIARFANYLAGQGDNIIIGKFLGANSLGMYSRAYAIMVQPVNLIGSAMDSVLFPAIATVQHDKSKIAKAYINGVAAIATISLPLSVLIVIISPEIVNVLLGSDWLEAVVPLQLLAGAMMFRMGYKISDSLTRATGDVYKRAWRQVIYALLVLIGTYIGSFQGLSGVAIGVAFAIIVNYFLMAHLSLKIIDISWNDYFKSHIPGIYTALITGILIYIIINIIRLYINSNIITVIISTISYCLITFLLLLKFPKLMLGENNEWIQKIIFDLISKKK